MNKSRLLGAVCACVFSFASLSSNAATVIYNNQVDKIQLPPDAFTSVGDQYSLTITGPVTSTVAITLSSADIVGCNLCNATVKWGEAINDDPVMSGFLTATYDVWDGESVVPFGNGTVRADYDPAILLTANTAGVEFFSSVWVLSAGLPKTNPSFTDLAVSVETIVPAQVVVPIPASVWLFGSGLLGLVGMARCSSHLTKAH